MMHCLMGKLGNLTQVISALHPSGVAKLSNGFGWGKGGKVIAAGWLAGWKFYVPLNTL